jgi:lambda repressor-like predicted transcriptional regulator
MIDYARLREEAIALRRQGFSLNQIGRRLGVRATTVSRWVAEVPFDGFNAESRAEQFAAVRDPVLYNRALELRKAGWSFKMIEAETGVPRSTLSGWLRYVEVLKYHPAVRQRTLVGQRAAVAANKRRLQALQEKVRDDAIHEMRELFATGVTDRELFLIGLTLYWAEGGKTSGQVSIANSDPAIIKTFVLWVERCLKLGRAHLRANVHTHPDVDPDEAETYWSEIIGIPRSQFYKIQIDTRTNKSVEKRGKLPHGTAHVTVLGQGTRNLHRKILDWIACFGEEIGKLTRA